MTTTMTKCAVMDEKGADLENAADERAHVGAAARTRAQAAGAMNKHLAAGPRSAGQQRAAAASVCWRRNVHNAVATGRFRTRARRVAAVDLLVPRMPVLVRMRVLRVTVVEVAAAAVPWRRQRRRRRGCGCGCEVVPGGDSAAADAAAIQPSRRPVVVAGARLSVTAMRPICLSARRGGSLPTAVSMARSP